MSNSLIGIAGVHYVVSELSRRGLVALPTVKNIAAYDIVALNLKGTWHANIQVKASSKRVSFFPMPAAKKVRTGKHDFYVLIRWLERENTYEGFLLSGHQARRAVQDICRIQRKAIRSGTRRKEFPCIEVGRRNASNANGWRKAWLSWPY